MIRPRNPDPVIAADMMEHTVGAGHREIDIIALALEPDPARRDHIALDLTGRPVLDVAPLQRDEAAAVDHDVRIRRAGGQILADHQPRLAVRIAAGLRRREGDVGGDVEIARALGPEIVEGVRIAPDIGAAASHAIGIGLRIEGRIAVPGGRADIPLRVELADPRRGWRRAGKQERNRNPPKNEPLRIPSSRL